MKLTRSLTIFSILSFVITILGLGFGTDYQEYLALNECLQNPNSFCPSSISVTNYSPIIRLYFKVLGANNSIFLPTYIALFLGLYGLHRIAKFERLNPYILFIGFLLVYMKDYYLNALSQGLALSIFVLSYCLNRNNFLSYTTLGISTLTHPSSALYYFKNISFRKVEKLVKFYIIFTAFIFIFFAETPMFWLIEQLSNFSGKLNYYLITRIENESLYSVLVKLIVFFLIIKHIPKEWKTIYAIGFALYISLLQTDILANRVLGVVKIFEIIAISKIYNRRQTLPKILIWIYLLMYLLINFL